MAQETQLIGEISGELEAVVRQRQGWGGVPGGSGLATEAPETLAGEYEDRSDFSFRDRRANFHAMGFEGGLGPYSPNPPMAGHWETPVAGTTPDAGRGALPGSGL